MLGKVGQDYRGKTDGRFRLDLQTCSLISMNVKYGLYFLFLELCEFTYNRPFLRIRAYSHQEWKQMFRNTNVSIIDRGMWGTSRSHRRKIYQRGIRQEQP